MTWLLPLCVTLGVITKLTRSRRGATIRSTAVRSTGDSSRTIDSRTVLAALTIVCFIASTARHFGLSGALFLLAAAAGAAALGAFLVSNGMSNLLGHIGIGALIGEVAILGGTSAALGLSAAGAAMLVCLRRITSK